MVLIDMDLEVLKVSHSPLFLFLFLFLFLSLFVSFSVSLFDDEARAILLDLSLEHRASM